MAGKQKTCKFHFGSPNCMSNDMCPCGIKQIVRADFVKTKSTDSDKHRPDGCNSTEKVFVKRNK